MVLDGASWHRSNDLALPDNLTLLRLPPYSPELNPIENLFGFLKSNYLVNRVFATVDDVHAAIIDAWTKIVQNSDRLSPITSRTWAKCTPQNALSLAQFYRKELTGIGISYKFQGLALEISQVVGFDGEMHNLAEKLSAPLLLPFATVSVLK